MTTDHLEPPTGNPSTTAAPRAAPVFLRRPRLAAPPRRLLVPLDFAPGCGAAVHAARSLAEPTTEFQLLHVIDPELFRPLAAGDHRIDADCTHHLREIAVANGLPDDRVCIEVQRGDPATAILQAIVRRSPDAVVLGVGRLALGPLARAILESAPCPAIVVERR